MHGMDSASLLNDVITVATVHKESTLNILHNISYVARLQNSYADLTMH